MDATNSATGDPPILNALIDMLKNGRGQQITMMVHEAISKVTPSSVNLVGMKDPAVPSTTSTVMPDDISRGTPTNTNVPDVGSVRILPPTTEQVSLRSLIDSQSRILRLLPDTPENVPTRQEILVQIQLWERALLESARPTSDEQEINDKVIDAPIGASTSTPKTTTISSVTTKGTQEVTILLTSEGNVLKDEVGLKNFHFIFCCAEQLFGNTIQMDWRKQSNAKKEELFKDVITAFGNPGFNKDIILDIARKYMHSKRDNLRSKLTKDLRYPRPAWITDQVTWDELMKDAKFKRKSHNNPNYRTSTQGGSKRCLRDTPKATQARVSSIGSDKLGSGGYNSIRGGLVHQFQKEASEEDLKYALLHGSQGLRQHLVDRGEILVSGHESEETIFEFQQVRDNNMEEGVQCDELSTPTIRKVPRKRGHKARGWIETSEQKTCLLPIIVQFSLLL
ncbi:uncharacterized protein LOC131055519 isoform X1 [Cryptomeria japonica]|uniref:uncharacterized protein LOC131055519 isoform X1 n=2 Tax=Cryptomeria japonica TaxID=3369 RepID=UPI0025ABCFBF|nr:uncharacterized protein LOC131055519 isoform X1 [Cryptomeria japonica]XP_057845963.1 uncharacterized protein LOC131055519 isoform X1 [Cryptomeria japonica]XP_057845964.1 uncharacterized protein LOC131055519 isoform X1 [Cryptomeria japonica]